jgi:hypothetical protein
VAQEDVNKLTNMFMSVWDRYFKDEPVEVVLEKLLGEIVDVDYYLIYDRLNEYYVRD